MKRLLAVLLIIAFFGSVALAATRTWKSSNGRFSVEAELLGFEDGKVQLKKADGKVIKVPLKSLSAADRRFVEKQYPEAAAPDGAKKEKEADATPPKDDEEEADDGPLDIEMKPLRVEPPKRKSRGRSSSLSAYILQLTRPQRFTQKGKGGGPAEAQFRRVVKKEPKYVFQIPFRGVVKFAGRSYGFSLDATGKKAVGYDRLYFDANGNGDLTDDPTTSATDVAQKGPTLSQSQFPRVNVTLDAGGEKVEHAFTLGVVCSLAGGNFQATASIYSALAREGYITQGKKRTKVLLIDRNSNGRFDDVVSVKSNGSLAEGDLLLINPNTKKGPSAGGMGTDRKLVAKTVCIGRSFYRMSVAPDGGKLKLEPTNLQMGNVVSSGHSYRAVLSSDDFGVVVITGARDQKVVLAEGTWKVINYVLDATRAGGKRTAVEASYGNKQPTVTVEKGETAELPFGGAFRAIVTSGRTKDKKIALRLQIVGPVGERCRSILVKGGRPPKPRFVIKDKNDKIVHQGEFEYG